MKVFRLHNEVSSNSPDPCYLFFFLARVADWEVAVVVSFRVQLKLRLSEGLFQPLAKSRLVDPVGPSLCGCASRPTSSHQPGKSPATQADESSTRAAGFFARVSLDGKLTVT